MRDVAAASRGEQVGRRAVVSGTTPTGTTLPGTTGVDCYPPLLLLCIRGSGENGVRASYSNTRNHQQSIRARCGQAPTFRPTYNMRCKIRLPCITKWLVIQPGRVAARRRSRAFQDHLHLPHAPKAARRPPPPAHGACSARRPGRGAARGRRGRRAPPPWRLSRRRCSTSRRR